jgi:hypothetical protein
MELTAKAIRTLAQEAKDTNCHSPRHVLSDSPLLLSESRSFRNLGKPLKTTRMALRFKAGENEPWEPRFRRS